MTAALVLDSGPLALILQNPNVKVAHECQEWLKAHVAAGVRIIVPELVDYELRRELLRLGKATALGALDVFNALQPDRYLPLTTRAMRLAAQMWAQLRQHGIPTSDRHALDVDVILVAQVLDSGLQPADFVVATTNPVHLSRVAPAEFWSAIQP